MKILITGVTGLIGKHLALHLLQAGHDVRALARNPKSVSFLPAQNVAAWDIGKTPLDLKWIEGMDAIVHLAGVPVAEGRWTEERKREIKSSRVDGTKEWAEALAKLPTDKRPAAFLSASAIGFYGDRGEELLTESSLKGTDFLATVTDEWEHAAQPIEALGIRLVLLRTGIVLSRSGGALAQMKPVVLGDGSAWVSWIHLEDEIRLIEYAIKNSVVKGVINLSSPHPVTNKVFTHALAKVLHVPVVLSAPKFALKAALGEFSDTVLSSQRVIPDKAMIDGFQFHYTDVRKALEAIYPSGSGLDTFFESAQFVPKGASEVFSFFSSAENLETLTPPWVGFKILKQSTPKIEKDTLIDYRLKIHGMPIKWQTKIEKWEDGKSFVDIQLKGPYSKWHHEHTFFAVKGGTLILDQVTYRVPVSFAGKLLLGKFIGNDVKKIFSYRTKKITELFGNG